MAAGGHRADARHAHPRPALLGAPPSIGMHFGTFQLTLESIDAPLTDLAEGRHARGVPDARFGTLAFGGSLRLERP